MRSLVLPVAAAIALAAPVSAATYTVKAKENSSSGGTGVATVAVTAGTPIATSASATDLWSAGALPRWSNADGLIVDLFATGSDESGEPAGTLIGTVFPLWTQSGLTAPYGSLVGEIGGVYKLLGLSFSGPAWGTGTLNLYYWDENNFDNFQEIAVTVRVVPEPATWAMLIAGFGLVGTAFRRRQRTLAAA